MRRVLPAFLLLMFATRLCTGESLTYEKDIRPILRTHCFHCHGEQGVIEGGLDLRMRRLIAAGGESGPAVVPGNAQDSLLLTRVVDGEMPPAEVDHRPTSAELDAIREWIVAGAPTARPEPDISPEDYVTEEERNFWSFRPLQNPELPDIQHPEQIETIIDRFILARLEPQGLLMSPEAGRSTLIRRVYFDLLGLPPTPEQVAQFLADSSPGAYERLVDRVLASPQYGERWGRHWLDVAGYADSEGYVDEDPVRPDSYRYRDYVIRAWNADFPLDQFIVQQLAGDELVAGPLDNLSPEDARHLIATGFLRTVPDGTASSNTPAARNEVIAQTLNVVSTALLGLTVGCAQCHDHRYDPISQRDYYAFRAIFEPAFNWKQWKTPRQRRLSLYTDVERTKAAEIEQQAKEMEGQRTRRQTELIEQVLERELAKLPAEVQEAARQARATDAKQRSSEQQALLKKYPSINVSAGSLYLYDKQAADELKKLADEAKRIRESKPEEGFVRALHEETQDSLPETFLFTRGDIDQPGEAISPSELTVLCQPTTAVPENAPELTSTGRRLAYARWLTGGEHPLVARVLVNRIWMHHFGRGLVATPGDFGFLGERPSHPQLLDWLARQLVENGWSAKEFHRLIMTSRVYRQQTQQVGEASEVDAENRLYWRKPVQRIEAEVFRDALLLFRGELNERAFGPPVPVMADRVGQFVIGIENLNAGRPGPVIPMNGEEFRRSVYIQVRRSRPLSVMDPFDLPRQDPNCVIRPSSTVSPQSLVLMNNQFVLQSSQAMARRLTRETSDDLRDQIDRAWKIVYSRPPTIAEVEKALQFLELQTQVFGSKPQQNEEDTPELEALGSLCHALISSNELLYVD